MLKESTFFEFLNRRVPADFDEFMAKSTEDEHYINWNDFVLPLDYGDAESEYFAIRKSCAIFDVSPIRKIRIRGIGAGAFLDLLMTRPVSNLPAMRASYTVFCSDDGSLKDDAILYKFANDDYLLMPSDIDHSAYFESLCQRFSLDDVAFDECTDTLAGVAIQGPKSATVLVAMGFDEIQHLKPFKVRDYNLDGETIRICRLGFTADLGYECWFAPRAEGLFKERIQSVRSTMDVALPGYGLSALDACRLEGGFIVAGWDCATEVEPNPGFERSPYELGLGWLVNLEAADFVGKDALREQKRNGHQYALRRFAINEQCQPEDGASIVANAGDAESVGIINCSAWSWGLNKLIGNASIKSEHANLEHAWISVNGRTQKLTLGKGPHLTLDISKQVPAPLIP